MNRLDLSSEFLEYLASLPYATTPANGDAPTAEVSESTRLPSLNDLSKELGVSVACLREQLEVAKALGLVEVRPRTGIRRLPYNFAPAVRLSLFYALTLDPSYFETFTELRNQVEASFWPQAVRNLTAEDLVSLQGLIDKAWEKLRGTPIQIPQREHRQLHMTIFGRLNNPFVIGLLEAYWDAYEAVGMSMYADYEYLQQVWRYHQEMVTALCNSDFDGGYRALVEHKGLLNRRPNRLVISRTTERRSGKFE